MPDPTLTREQIDEMDLALSTYGSDDRVPMRAGHLKALVALARGALAPPSERLREIADGLPTGVAVEFPPVNSARSALRRIADALEVKS